jgi:translation initiation factor 1
VIEKLALAPEVLALWCKELKSALGCGGLVDGDAIVLQGDLRPRLEAVLLRRGVRKVTIAG